MALSGSSYGDSIFQLQNPSQNYYNLQKDQAALNSNSLEDQVRRNNIEIGKQQAAQEAIKTQEVDELWKAQQSDREARKEASKVVANEGYDPSSSPDYVPLGGYNPVDRPHVFGPAGTDPGVVSGAAAPAAIAPAGPAMSNSLAGTTAQTLPAGYFQQGPTGDPAALTAAPGVTPYPGAVPVDGANSVAGGIAQQTTPPPPAPSAAPATPSTSSATQPTEPTLPPIDLRNPATYHMEVDEDKYRQFMNQRGHGDYGQAQSTARQKAVNAVYEAQKNQYEAAAKKNQSISDAALAVIGIGPIDLDNPDQNAVEAQKAQFITNARFQMRRLMQAGVIKPQEEAAYEQIFNRGYSPQLYQTVSQLANSADGGVKHMKMEQEAVESRQRILNGQSTREKEDADAYEKRLGLAGQEAAGTKDKPTWDAFFQRQPPKVQAAIKSIYDDGYSPANAQKIADMARTPEQKARDTETKRQHDVVDAQRDESQSFREATKQQGRNTDKAQFNRDYTELTKLQDQERKIYAERKRLGDQLKNAGTPGSEFQYIQANGATKPSSLMRDAKTKKPDPKEAAAAVSDMQSRYDAATESLKQIINQKYDITKDTGKVPREQALADLDKKGTLPAAKAATNPAPAPKASATKTAPATATIPDSAKAILEEGIIQTFKLPSGEETEWTLKNGKPVKVK